MGYDVDRFVNCDKDIIQQLLCCICLDVLEDAIQTQCGHSFCGHCFQQVIGDTVECRCPICKKTVHRNGLSQIPISMKNIINNLNIRCDYHKLGCGQVIKVESIKHHLKSCEFAPLSHETENEISNCDTNSDGESSTSEGNQQPRDNRCMMNNTNSGGDNVSDNITPLSHETANEIRNGFESRISQSSQQPRDDDRQLLLPQQLGHVNGGADNGIYTKSYCRYFRYCYCSIFILLMHTLMTAFIFITVIGVYHIKNCDDRPEIPFMLAILGITGFLMIICAIIIIVAKIEDRMCFFLFLLSVIFFLTMFFISLRFGQIAFLKPWWVPEYDFNCNVYVVWCSIYIRDIFYLFFAVMLVALGVYNLYRFIKFVPKCWNCLF